RRIDGRAGLGDSVHGQIRRRFDPGDNKKLPWVLGSVKGLLKGRLDQPPLIQSFGCSSVRIFYMIRPIVLWGSEVLEKPSEPISNITDAEVKLVQDMIETMYKAPGVGLAAPQVGVGKRIMVTDTTSGEKKDHLFTLFNPEIISTV